MRSVIAEEGSFTNVFFYGLFADQAIVVDRGVPYRNPRSASVEGHALRVGRNATLVTEIGAVTPGVLLELTDPEIERLYVDLPMYSRQVVPVQLAGGETIPALCLICPLEPYEDAGHRRNYLIRLREILDRWRLPVSHIDAEISRPGGGRSLP